MNRPRLLACICALTLLTSCLHLPSDDTEPGSTSRAGCQCEYRDTQASGTGVVVSKRVRRGWMSDSAPVDYLLTIETGDGVRYEITVTREEYERAYNRQPWPPERGNE